MRIIGFGLAILLCVAHTFASDPNRVVDFDTVHLLRTGETIEGKAEHSFVTGSFTYQFVSAENLAAFMADVQRYEIQLGGACARMGPLSGEGTPRLHAVHDGKLYIFASESCRMRFLASPETYLAKAEDAPMLTPEQSAKGREMLGRAVDSLACKAQSDLAQTVRFSFDWEDGPKGKTYHVKQTVTLSRFGGLRDDVCWDDSCVSYTSTGDAGWIKSSSQMALMNPSQLIEHRRGHSRHLLPILWARDSADQIAGATGERRTVTIPGEGEIELDVVIVHRAGATTLLGMDDLHQVRWRSWHGPGHDLTLGRNEHIYSDFREVGGLRLPHRFQTFFNGQPVPSQSGTFSEIVINDPIDASRFERPAELTAASQPPASARTLTHEATIAAPIQQVWEAWTTSDGFASWAVAKAQVDLRVGGDMRTSYDPQSNLDDDSTIVNRILAYEPPRMLAIRNVRAPKGFKGADLFAQAWTVVYLDPIAPDRTHIRIVGLGYGEGSEWDELHRKFDAGNAYTLHRLKMKFAPDAPVTSDPDAVLAMMKNLVGGEWIHEGTAPDGRIFRVRNVYHLAPDGKSLVARGWLGDAQGMHEHGAIQIYREPGESRVVFQNIDETGSISRGEIRLVDADTLEWDWNRTTQEGKTAAFRIHTRLPAPDLYQFTLYSRADDEWRQMAQLEYTRVDKAPQRFLPPEN